MLMKGALIAAFAAAGTVAVVAGANAAVQKGVGTQHPLAATASATPADARQAAQAYAEGAVRSVGESSYSDLQWVESTRAAAAKVVSGAVLSPDQTQSVYAIQVHGRFTARLASTFSGQPPAGTVMTVIVDEATGVVLDFGLSDVDANLAALGTVHTA